MAALFHTTAFWIPLGQIIGVNLVLSGDNAVVLALAAHALPPKHQKAAMLLGSLAAIACLVGFTLCAAHVLTYPYVKCGGSVVLFWIGVKVVAAETPAGAAEPPLHTTQHLWTTIKTMVIADLVMSLDNILAVAAAAQGQRLLLILGLAISVPLILCGSTFLVTLMARFPVLVTLGAALIGCVAGEMATTDVALTAWMQTAAPLVPNLATIGGALVVVVVGKWVAKGGASA
jgi:YjbE family integral membrane protein